MNPRMELGMMDVVNSPVPLSSQPQYMLLFSECRLRGSQNA